MVDWTVLHANTAATALIGLIYRLGSIPCPMAYLEFNLTHGPHYLIKPPQPTSQMQRVHFGMYLTQLQFWLPPVHHR